MKSFTVINPFPSGFIFLNVITLPSLQETEKLSFVTAQIIPGSRLVLSFDGSIWTEWDFSGYNDR